MRGSSCARHLKPVIATRRRPTVGRRRESCLVPQTATASRNGARASLQARWFLPQRGARRSASRNFAIAPLKSPLAMSASPQISAGSANFGAYWNQVTPENGGKWGTAQPVSPFGPADQGYPALPNPAFNFTQATQAYLQARNNGHVFKWHVLFWGNQQPGWIESLPVAKQEEAIRIWLAAIAAQFPDLEQIEVVNEPLHDPPRGPTNGNYIEALGGDNGLYGTGWDWIIRAFELAREYFPNAKLMLNDFCLSQQTLLDSESLQP